MKKRNHHKNRLKNCESSCSLAVSSSTTTQSCSVLTSSSLSVPVCSSSCSDTDNSVVFSSSSSLDVSVSSNSFGELGKMCSVVEPANTISTTSNTLTKINDDEKNEKIFNIIKEFISDLTVLNLKNVHSYNTILKATTLQHKVAIKKHVSLFKNYCCLNNDAIREKNKDLLKSRVVYSKKVFLDFKLILLITSEEETETIWKYLLLLLYYIDPSDKTRSILKTITNEEDRETKLVDDIVTKLSNAQPSEETDATTAIMNLMSSGVISEITSNITSESNKGNINLKKLLGTMNNLIEKLMNEEDKSDKISKLKR